MDKIKQPRYCNNTITQLLQNTWNKCVSRLTTASLGIYTCLR